VRPSGQGGNRASGSSDAPLRILFQALSRKKERWQIPPHSRPEGTQ
jgi:hypothetical protein